MSSQSISSNWSVIEQDFQSCGDVRSSPERVFEWRGRYPANPESPRSRTARPSSYLYVFDSKTGEKLHFRASLLGTVAEAKERLAETVLELPPALMRLSWSGLILDDARTLLSYGIHTGQCLHLLRCSEPGRSASRKAFSLMVHRLGGSPKHGVTKLCVPALASHTVVQVKQRLEELTGVVTNDQRLMSCGRTLNNETQLWDYGIEDDSMPMKLLCAPGDSTSSQARARRSLEGPHSPPHIAAMLERSAKPASGGAAVADCSDFSVAVQEPWPLGQRHRAKVTASRTAEGNSMDAAAPHPPPHIAVLERNSRFASSALVADCSDFPVTVQEVFPPGRRHRVRLTLGRTVLAIKRQLESRSGVAVHEQLLLHRGRALRDDLTAKYYNIASGDNMQLALVGGALAVEVRDLSGGAQA